MTGYVIETRNLTKSFKGFTAVDDVSLQVAEGTIHALIGPNGAGKSTMFNLITKFLQPTSGTILLNGENITKRKPAEIARMGAVRSFQISSVFPHLTLLENIRVALQRKMHNSYHFWKSESRLNVLNDEARSILSTVGLDDAERNLAVELPYGRKRLLELATTIALEPQVLLLDEPMAGMGTGDVQRVADIIRRVAEGRTVLMVEHNLSVVADLSDTITVLQRGAVLAEGTYDEVSRNPEVISAYMGAAHHD
ncbi:ABC transporter ATP-binding protein [Notoacmeibacter sp. MSK16QG-6]|uniref:ABC transporter ATP-binding protein n=1 Tax=Notoacmeibacter sp. MSK16QG-6 TaxID=2957982 RepID=UPI00209E0A2F|nr:ABC transporter ATP-binding protein [Notoacmeibacter sp. MSK16QG-6]MCP1198661.1 ABC transporter ATP-binding protein [Notoacmeibacter sp. MSK16QG-6]